MKRCSGGRKLTCFAIILQIVSFIFLPQSKTFRSTVSALLLFNNVNSTVDHMDPIKLDGRVGEGGGQLVRLAIGLAALTGTPVHIENVRGNRPGKRGGGMYQSSTVLSQS